ncbi:hypothetical protein E3N88_10008 [Mikania micrantha]|uniref:Aminotransferase-like plant mobile domain-containing protein n=1 Tax=Mikania micrantha TaxID=192012 RepID=A0A5N6PBR6_9ASTR|nr:hypothetical protein E3N88_10008 [Mikania micrantha]
MIIFQYIDESVVRVAVVVVHDGVGDGGGCRTPQPVAAGGGGGGLGHTGDYYFQNPERDEGILRIRRGDQDFWVHLNSNPIPENVVEFITLAGFGVIILCGNRRIDRALISALVERWRLETHTFHLPIGETTITLHDVNILWGSPIEGNVVSGADLTLNGSQIASLFENLRGVELPLEAIRILDASACGLGEFIAGSFSGSSSLNVSKREAFFI